MQTQVNKLLLLIFGFVITLTLSISSYLYISHNNLIEIYSASTLDSGAIKIKVNEEILGKDNSYFDKKDVAIQLGEDNKIFGSINSVSGIKSNQIISGELENNGEFRIRIENNSISGPIFIGDDTYLITTENDSLVLNYVNTNIDEFIVEDKETVVTQSKPVPQDELKEINKDKESADIAKTSPKVTEFIGNPDLAKIKQTEKQLSEVYNESNVLSTTYPQKTTEVLKKVEPIEKDESYLFVPEQLNETENTFKLELGNQDTLEVKKDGNGYFGESVFQNNKDSNNRAFITYSDGVLAGEVIKNGETFEILPTKLSRTHKLKKVKNKLDMNNLGEDIVDPATDTRILKGRTINHTYKVENEREIVDNKARISSATTTDNLLDDSKVDGIDIAVMYTTEASQLSGSSSVLQTKISQNINSLNRILSNNQVKTHVNLVGVAHISGNVEVANQRRGGDVLYDLASNAAVMDYRIRRKADLVMFITGELNGICGAAYLGHYVERDADWAYAATVGSSSCMATSWGTFSHEVGHNLGLEHDKPNAGGSQLGYNYGYTDKVSFRDVMSYANTCTQNCPMIEYFSDNIRRWNGKQIGTPTSDNARALRHSVQITSNYFNKKTGKLATDDQYYKYRPKGFFTAISPLPESVAYSKDVELKWITRKLLTPDPETGEEVPTNPTRVMISLRDDHGFTYLEEKDFSDICSTDDTCSYTITVPKERTYYWLIQPLDYNGSNASWTSINHEVKFDTKFTKPIAGFHIEGANEGHGNLSVQFKNDSQFGSSYEWDFDGDNIVDSTEKDPVFNYTDIGTYSVNLKAINGNGEDIEVETDIVNVKPPLVDGDILGRNTKVIDFRNNPVFAKRSGEFEFKIQDKSLATAITTVSWDLNNDGAIESTDNVYLVALNEGKYTLTAIISDGVTSKEVVKKDFIIVTSQDTDGAGSFAPSTGEFYLSGPELSSNDPLDTSFRLENVPLNSSQRPIAGDWDGNGLDSVGIFDYVSQTWYLTNSVNPTSAEIIFVKGIEGETNLSSSIPIAGDFDGDGKDSIGLYLDGKWYVSNDIYSSGWNTPITFGGAPIANGPFHPMVGDWNGDGIDTFGYYSAANWKWDLSNEQLPVTSATPNFRHLWQVRTPNSPIVGDWDGDGKDDIGSIGSYNFIQKFLGGNKPTQTKGYEMNGSYSISGNW